VEAFITIPMTALASRYSSLSL